MAYTTIDRPSNYFRTKLYTGNASTQSITFDESTNMQPDCTWTKGRTGTYGVSNHKIYDVIRGATKTLFINLTNAETTQTNTLTSFNSNGFSLGDDSNINWSSTTYASWSWKANGTGVSNTSGTISSTVSANTTSGFSIVKWTGSGANATVGHGLGVAPKMIIIKNYGDAVDTENWRVGHSSVSSTFSSGLLLSTNDASWTQSGVFNNTAPTSSVFTVGTFNSANGSADNMIAYCFAEVKGFSKFGSYTGNGSANGTFVYTGFKPAFVLRKRTDTTGNWILQDNKRTGINQAINYTSVLYANSSDAETIYNEIDIVSNGFKIRADDSFGNASGGTYIYMAFADSPFVSSKGIPTTAR